MKKITLVAAAAALGVTATAAHAESFNVANPDSMAMGGAGVALPNPATSTLFNPAELSVTPKEYRNGFNLGLSVGAEAYDPHNVIQKINQGRETLNRLQQEVSNLGPSSSQAQYNAIANNIVDISYDLTLMNRHSVAAMFGTNLVVNHAGHGLGIGLTISGTANVASQTVYTSHDKTYLANIQLAAKNRNYATLGNFSEKELTSNVRAVGVGIAQAGLTLSHQFHVVGQSLSIGVTPKVMDIYTINVSSSPSNAKTSEWTKSRYRNQHTAVNADLGILKHFHNGVYTGVTVHNIVPEHFKTQPDSKGRVETVDIDPEARVGVGYGHSWYRLGVDADLTRNQPLPLVKATRYVGAGGEINAFGWMQLRAGYRWDTLDSARNVVTAGVGFSPFNVVHIDMGGLYAKSDYGASVQLGLSI